MEASAAAGVAWAGGQPPFALGLAHCDGLLPAAMDAAAAAVGLSAEQAVQRNWAWGRCRASCQEAAAAGSRNQAVNNALIVIVRRFMI